ncbi:capsule assembly Wzi family protein [Dyadobacter jiangsuensis]|uniref:Capsule assembly protein Wzi n=1 Tax=Dyadobacter jiangsuensis TaxID=1591085 RepID=A0A2P8FGH7_9BACT|nr:capsule assembly Wzi family protein [Dyadobacter jiangsuensis]PSL20822.1 capsule assembly protein Wzi [Dyadobacter jiangsuensis]
MRNLSPLKLILSVFVSLLSITCLGYNLQQQSSLHTDSAMVSYQLTALASSGNRTPFWIQTNQFGTVSAVGSGLGARLSLDYFHRKPHSAKFRWAAGAEVVANVGSQSKVLVPQVYVGIQTGNWELVAGRRRQWIGLADSTLGTGSYVWSTNTMPIPKIQFGTSRFVSVPLTGRWLYFHGFYSEGLFESSRPITSRLKLHQKMAYFRIGRDHSRVKLLAGFNHQVQWGGRSSHETIDGRMPNGIKNYFRIVSGKPGDASSTPNSFDDGNRVGNHLGTIDLGLELEGYTYSLFVYRQNIYEDGTLYALRNIKDGLNGFRFRRKNSYGANFEISEFVLEFLYTKSQGGPDYDYEEQIIHRGSLGRDDYFNNAQVRDGWSYYGRTIGTPFITPTAETIWAQPQYADFFTSNNRVSVYHLGVRGKLFRRVEWAGKYSYSSNWGTYNAPFKSSVRQFSAVLNLQTRVSIAGPTDIGASFGLDTGKLFPQTFGAMLTVRKQMSIY